MRMLSLIGLLFLSACGPSVGLLDEAGCDDVLSRPDMTLFERGAYLAACGRTSEIFAPRVKP